MLKQIKTILVVIAALAVLASCQTANKDVRDQARNAIETGVQPAENMEVSVEPTNIPTGPTTVMEFEETEFDFGVVQEGQKVSHTYKFKNTGTEPLVLSNAQGSCGCTVPQWPRDPIAPGKSGEIVVEFNTQGKAGNRNQKVTITANTNPPQLFLSLKGQVAGGEGTDLQMNQ
ncbi:MAG TPA: DUF1573 domain-containing protein [Saprospiraceae bacterium]|nr:DUF1573 domain-containing protein [Saprospiraceae bacterium]HMP24878.1 DUF1573 domain-containing protein [Saprospiraceae bacterium]